MNSLTRRIEFPHQFWWLLIACPSYELCTCFHSVSDIFHDKVGFIRTWSIRFWPRCVITIRIFTCNGGSACLLPWTGSFFIRPMNGLVVRACRDLSHDLVDPHTRSTQQSQTLIVQPAYLSLGIPSSMQLHLSFLRMTRSFASSSCSSLTGFCTFVFS
jgi:hypothetical protein